VAANLPLRCSPLTSSGVEVLKTLLVLRSVFVEQDFHRGWMLFLSSNQQHESTEGTCVTQSFKYNSKSAAKITLKQNKPRENANDTDRDGDMVAVKGSQRLSLVQAPN